MSGVGASAFLYGPFHRKRSPTQDQSTADKQERGHALLGRPTRWGIHPVVKAYRGALPASEQGIEFFTIAAPVGTHPDNVFWWDGDADVWQVRYQNETFAMIVAR